MFPPRPARRRATIDLVRARRWPTSTDDLVATQVALGRTVSATASLPPARDRLVGACFVCRGKGGTPHEPAWAAAAVLRGRRTVDTAVVAGPTPAPYEPGLLARRDGALLAAAVEALTVAPHVLLVNATGRDHPRRAGLALHLGAVLELPTAGVTARTLLAAGEWPGAARGASSPLVLEGEIVGYWLRTRAGARPVAVHGGWALPPDEALEVVRAAMRRARTPEPLRAARRAAREARAGLTEVARPDAEHD
jgi:deoxyribonuclease V